MPFTKGISGNPLGRGRGSKNKFSKIKEDWLKAYNRGGGVKLFSRLIKEDLPTFFKIGVSWLPKEVNLDVDGRLVVKWLDENDQDTVQTS